jgi:plastocyanin
MITMEGRRTDVLERMVAGVGVTILLMLPAACGGSEDLPSCLNPQAESTVVMDEFVYLPDCVEAAAGAELEIVNGGQAPHTFTVESDGTAAEVDVPAGEQADLTVPDLTAGTYRISCTYHPQMEGALRVPPAS